MRPFRRKKVRVISVPDQEKVGVCRLLNYVVRRWEKQLRLQEES
jgi:hypothetical protein